MSSNDAFPYSAEMVKVLSTNDREFPSKGVHVDGRYRVDSNSNDSPSRQIESKASDFIKNTTEEDEATAVESPGPSELKAVAAADASLSNL